MKHLCCNSLVGPFVTAFQQTTFFEVLKQLYWQGTTTTLRTGSTTTCIDTSLLALVREMKKYKRRHTQIDSNDPSKKYIGSNDCVVCHRLSLAISRYRVVR
jgi:hypothetical protein